MQVGDRKAIVKREKCGQHGVVEEKSDGTVTYIHPLHRFYVVRFDAGYSESFRFGEG